LVHFPGFGIAHQEKSGNPGQQFGPRPVCHCVEKSAHHDLSGRRRLVLTGNMNLSAAHALDLVQLGPATLMKNPGTDVMITIFCDFDNFRRKNWRFSQKPML
jgi:hypothetical protein